MEQLFPQFPLVWMDLEMTGLNSEKDVILEIATVITDKDLRVIETGPDFIVHQPESALRNLDPVVIKMHTESGLFDKVRASTITLEQACNETFTFIKTHVSKKKSPLCGNSIWNDRGFLLKAMPELFSLLHYRMVDVSSIKVLLHNWYPHDKRLPFAKKKTHRALDDIYESIEELKFYRDNFFISAS
jgi:oligoribonuclease